MVMLPPPPSISTSISIYVVDVYEYDMYQECNWEINILDLVACMYYII